jgi:hypothetical protein
MRRIFVAILSVVALAAFAAPAVAQGVSDGPALYADGQQFRTLDATDLPAPRPNNAHSYDDLFVISGGVAAQLPVAEAAPGSPGFNGGRWAVTAVTWAAEATPELVTSSAEVHSLIESGELEVVAEGVRYFECPLVPLRG